MRDYNLDTTLGRCQAAMDTFTMALAEWTEEDGRRNVRRYFANREDRERREIAALTGRRADDAR